MRRHANNGQKQTRAQKLASALHQTSTWPRCGWQLATACVWGLALALPLTLQGCLGTGCGTDTGNGLGCGDAAITSGNADDGTGDSGAPPANAGAPSIAPQHIYYAAEAALADQDTTTLVAGSAGALSPAGGDLVIHNQRADTTVTVAATPSDGSFFAQVAAQVGDTLRMTYATDSGGENPSTAGIELTLSDALDARAAPALPPPQQTAPAPSGGSGSDSGGDGGNDSSGGAGGSDVGDTQNESDPTSATSTELETGILTVDVSAVTPPAVVVNTSVGAVRRLGETATTVTLPGVSGHEVCVFELGQTQQGRATCTTAE